MENEYKKMMSEIQLSTVKMNDLLNKEERKIIMKRNYSKIAVAVVACTLCISGTVWAANLYLNRESAVVPNTLSNEYSKVDDAIKETGLNFQCPQELGLGYSFWNYNLNDDEYKDNDGNVIETGKSFYGSYINKEGICVIYSVSPYIEQASYDFNNTDIAETINSTESTATYYYQEIDGEKKLSWFDSNNVYELSAYNSTLTAEDFVSFADTIMQ